MFVPLDKDDAFATENSEEYLELKQENLGTASKRAKQAATSVQKGVNSENATLFANKGHRNRKHLKQEKNLLIYQQRCKSRDYFTT